MRVPWYLVLFGVVGSMLLTWHLRTREMDFIAPEGTPLPPEDFGNDLAVGAPMMQPKIADGPKIDIPIKPLEPETIEIPEISDRDLGDLNSSPGLDEYLDFAKGNPAVRLLELSSMLQARGDFQRALLALERVIDTSPVVSSNELAQTRDAIASLAPTLPSWNVDPSSEIELTLLISSPNALNGRMKNVALNVATLIRKYSGDQLLIVPKIIKTGMTYSSQKPPLTISFVRKIAGKTISTAILTIRTGTDDDAEKFIKAVFRSVRGHLAKHGYPFPKDITAPAQDLLTLQITRLMWHDFANSLVPAAEKVEASEVNSP